MVKVLIASIAVFSLLCVLQTPKVERGMIINPLTAGAAYIRVFLFLLAH